MASSSERSGLTLTPRLAIDSALIVAGGLALIAWGGLTTTVTGQAKDIDSLKKENVVLSSELVKTQKDIIERLTRIETKMDIR